MSEDDGHRFLLVSPLARPGWARIRWVRTRREPTPTPIPSSAAGRDTFVEVRTRRRNAGGG